MYFTETEALRELEILMQMIPGFQPKGYGSMVMPDQIYIYLQEPPPPTYQEMIADTMHAVRYRPFLQRVEELLIESEMRPMNYLSNHHQKLFRMAIQKKDRKNYAQLSALYLFTADPRLWRIMRHQVEANLIRFDRRKLCGLNEYTYALVQEGTQRTTTGTWSVSFQEIRERFGLDLSADSDAGRLIVIALKQEEEINELIMTEDHIEMSYHLEYCPSCNQGDASGI